MMIIGPIIALIGGGCLGYVIAGLMFTTGSGAERERELRKKMIKDVQICCAEYDSHEADQICADVCHIIRSEQV